MKLSLEFDIDDVLQLAALSASRPAALSPLELVERFKSAAEELPIESVAPALIRLREWFNSLDIQPATEDPIGLTDDHDPVEEPDDTEVSDPIITAPDTGAEGV